MRPDTRKKILSPTSYLGPILAQDFLRVALALNYWRGRLHSFIYRTIFLDNFRAGAFYRPVKFGLRFSIKAAIPSFASSVAETTLSCRLK